MSNRTYQEDYYRLRGHQQLQPSHVINNSTSGPAPESAQCVSTHQFSSSVNPYTALNSNSYYNSSTIQPQQQSSQVYHHDYYSINHKSQSQHSQMNQTYDKDWLSDPRVVSDIEKGLRLTDKIETIEITSKDLSPASCCSNFDLLLHDYYNKSYTDFPSCSQVQNQTEHQQNIKQVKYCSIQKTTNQIHTQTSFDCNYLLNNQPLPTDCFQDVSIFPSQISTLSSELCADLNFDPVGVVDDVVSDDSDIIVEDLDDDDYVEEHEQGEIDQRRFNCLLCNVSYSPVGSQFYFLTAENPLTMSSQKSVSEKLKTIVGINNYITDSYLCNECLNLINTIDHLEMKLEGLKAGLIKKFEVSNNINGDVMQLKQVKFKNVKKCAHKLRCRICKKCFSLSNVFKCHMKKHRTHKNKRILCEICGRSYFNLKSFHMHSKEHSKFETRNHKTFKVIQGHCCSTCKKVFRTMSNLKEHANYCSGKLPYKCTKCHKKFPSTTKLKNHVKLKHEKKFTSICSICNIGFVQISDYKRHMISHSTLKKFNCTQCDKSYKTLSNLNFHMKFHAKKLPFICEICSKGFMRKEYLESHMASHTGDKNFSCSMCDKKFVSQKNLDAHLKMHSGNINKKACNICGKIISKIALEDHLRTHSNLKEFKCDKCDERFNTKSSLQKHKKRKHD